jgi:hypothetical protein
MQHKNISCSNLIIPARFIALDSSILGNIAKDYFSPDSIARKDATIFLDFLAKNAFIPFLCWHHFEELIKHRDNDITRHRFNFLQLLPQVAWITTVNGTLGSIVDLLAAECRTALQDSQLSVLEVRDQTRNSLISFGTGAEAIAPYEGIWQDLRPHLWKREEKAREIVAIRRANVNDITKEPVSNFINGAIRKQHEAINWLNQSQVKMAHEIQKHGDKRISDAREVASRFYNEILDSDDVSHLQNGGLQQYLNYLDIEIHDLEKNATMGDLLDTIEFRRKIKVVHKRFSVTWDHFKKLVKPNRIPSWIIENSLCLYSQKQNEHKGSELNDHYLACLSPYVDLIYVDRRMKNDFKRASHKNSVFCKLLNQVRVENVLPYTKIQEQIETITI